MPSTDPPPTDTSPTGHGSADETDASGSASGGALPSGEGGEPVHLTLQETATLHSISKSHLSRRVRHKKPAKGYDLRPYANIRKTGGKERITGFTFPPGYEPSDSRKSGQAEPSSEENVSEGKSSEEIQARFSREGAGSEGQGKGAPAETASAEEDAGEEDAAEEDASALREALARERARRKKAEEKAERAREQARQARKERDAWREVARSREEDLRERVETQGETLSRLRNAD